MNDVAVLTGGTSGIGRFIARGLVRAGFRLVVIGRDRALLASLAGFAGGDIETERADLSLVAEARAAAARIAARHPRLAILVNNAGVFTTRRAETAEGHERTLAVNHLVPFALTAAFRAALAAHGAARIVNVGSVMAERARLDLGDLELRRRWSGPRAYGRSKLALAAATRVWARVLAPDHTTANVVHPGSVGTGIVRDGRLAPLAWRLMRPFLLTPAQGAEAPLRLALAPELAGVTGTYVHRMTERAPERLALTPALEAELWTRTEALVAP